MILCALRKYYVYILILFSKKYYPKVSLQHVISCYITQQKLSSFCAPVVGRGMTEVVCFLWTKALSDLCFHRGKEIVPRSKFLDLMSEEEDQQIFGRN